LQWLNAGYGHPTSISTGFALPRPEWGCRHSEHLGSEGSAKVMLNNDSTTNRQAVPNFLDDGNFDPWGYKQHPQTIAELNSIWSCSSSTPVITVNGVGRETTPFQVFISASGLKLCTQLSTLEMEGQHPPKARPLRSRPVQSFPNA
jgi:hypothetical protein